MANDKAETNLQDGNADKLNVEAAEIIANEALRLPISDSVPIYEKVLATFPTSAKYWKQYVEALMAVNNDEAARQIRRCYIRFIRKIYDMKGIEGQEETKRAYEFMLDYVDYIGRVETNSLRTTRTEKTLRKILIRDEMKKDVEITLWPEKVHLIGNEVIPGDIVAITSMMVTEHNGRVQLESTYLTNAFVNPHMPQTIDHINRLNAIPPMEPSARNEQIATLLDIKLTSQQNIQNPKNFICKATIKRVHEDQGWYYVLCSKCGQKLYPQQKNDNLNFVCKDDDDIIPNFRYYVNATNRVTARKIIGGVWWRESVAEAAFAGVMVTACDKRR
ncbi:hypothetical protein CASFOL_041281 [Castilleja foliolosa]|uniref:Suppressor of forked domain-containing protein n=1 Tax=Castilleja foliolosa TaxID=1961234 RepID=A0ABD3BE03_9LAMI